MSRSLVWFRNDLRLHDNEALMRGCSRGLDGVACLYVVDPHWFGNTKFGFDRTGPFRARFLRESLVDLDRSLRERGSRLLIAHGDSATAVVSVAEAFSATHVYCAHELGTEEKGIERRVGRRLRDGGIQFSVSPTNTLHDAEDLPFSIAELPEIFSKFRRKVEKRCDVRPALPPPSTIPSIETATLPPNAFELSDIRLNELPEFASSAREADERGVLNFVGGETYGLARIDEYFFKRDQLRVYKETRNGMLGADYSSKLSAWLANGCLSPRLVKGSRIRGASGCKRFNVLADLRAAVARLLRLRFGKTRGRSFSARRTTQDEASLEGRPRTLRRLASWIDGVSTHRCQHA